MKNDKGYVEVVADNPIELAKHLAELDRVNRQAKLNKVTQYITTIVVWLVLGTVGGFAVWGIIVVLDLILKALGVK